MAAASLRQVKPATSALGAQHEQDVANVARRLFRFVLVPRANGARPPISLTLRVAEAFRSALLASLDGQRERHLITEQGLTKNHAHAHFLPIDVDDDGLLDILDVWMPIGNDARAEVALRRTLVVYDADVLRGGLIAHPAGNATSVSGTRWATVTPIVLDRFPKLRGTGVKHWIDPPDQQLRMALGRRGLQAQEIRVLPLCDERAFILRRRDGGRPMPACHAFIVLERKICGPLVLGSLAHFGLGRFEPIE